MDFAISPFIILHVVTQDFETIKNNPRFHCNFYCVCLSAQIGIWDLFTDTAYLFHLNRKLPNINVVAVYNTYNTHTHTYAVLREVRNTFGILVGNLNVRLFVRYRGACDSQLKWSVVRAGFNWLLIGPSVRSRQGICRQLVSVGIWKMTLWMEYVGVAFIFHR